MDDQGEARSRRPHRKASRAGSSRGSPKGSSRQPGAYRASRNLALARQDSLDHDAKRPGPPRWKGSGPFCVLYAPRDSNPEPAD